MESGGNEFEELGFAGLKSQLCSEGSVVDSNLVGGGGIIGFDVLQNIVASKAKDLDPGRFWFVFHELIALFGELDPLLALNIFEGFIDADSHMFVCLDVDNRRTVGSSDQVAVSFSHVVVAAKSVEVFQLVSSLGDHDPGEIVFRKHLFLGQSVKFQPLGGDFQVGAVVADHLVQVVDTSEDSWEHQFKYYIWYTRTIPLK